MGEPLGPDLEVMLAHAMMRMGGRLDHSEREKLSGHDASDPFSHTSISRSSAFQNSHLVFAGNQVRSPDMKWFSKDGSLIDLPQPLTIDWVIEQAEEIARQITAAGGNGRYAHRPHDLQVEEGEIVVRVPEYDRLSPTRTYRGNEVNAYWLTVHTRMQGVTGQKETKIWRINSVGRPDIGQQIVDRLRAHEALMPATPEEAEETAFRKASEVLHGLFLPYAIAPQIVSIRRDVKAQAVTIEIAHEMLDAMLQWKPVQTRVIFYGNDIGNPWRATVTNLGSARDAYKLAAEVARRRTLKANGGLRQTSLAKQVIETLGYKPNPFHSGYDGKTKPLRYAMKGDSATKGVLSIKSGRIEATMDVLDGKIKLSTGTFEIRGIELPETSLSGIKGTPLRAVLDHPAIPENVTIVSMTRTPGGGVKGKHRMPSYPVVTTEEAKE